MERYLTEPPATTNYKENGENVKMDISKLTLEEVGTIEQKSGLPFGAIGDNSKPKGKLFQALAYVIKRRENPSFSWTDAGKMTFDEINALITPEKDDEEEGKEG